MDLGQVVTTPLAVAPGKRPRSSMTPTLMLKNGKPFLALGSPGGSTIPTTVLQTIVNRVDLGMDLPAAVAEPRATQRNRSTVLPEKEFTDQYGAALGEYGHRFADPEEIGALTAVEFLPGGGTVAAAEPTRRGGGDARVVNPR